MLATGSRSPFKAETIDVSSGGIGLLVDVQVRAGTPITVELRFDNPKLDLSLDGVVMHAAPMDGRWFAGVRFVGIGLVEELELSRFVLNEERMNRANEPERRAPAAVAEGTAGDEPPLLRSGSGFYSSRLAAAS
jgi:c-di-GMP-binding flagellar brake protein YcgR